MDISSYHVLGGWEDIIFYRLCSTVELRYGEIVFCDYILLVLKYIVWVVCITDMSSLAITS